MSFFFTSLFIERDIIHPYGYIRTNFVSFVSLNPCGYIRTNFLSLASLSMDKFGLFSSVLPRKLSGSVPNQRAADCELSTVDHQRLKEVRMNNSIIKCINYPVFSISLC